MDGYREQHVLDEDLSSLASAAEDEETAGSEGLDGGSDEDGVPDDLDEDDSADCDGALYPRAGLDGSEADSEEVDSGSDGEGRAGVAALLSPSKRGPPFELGAFDSLAAGADFDTESDNDSVRKASFPLVDMGAEDGLAEDRVPSAEGRKSPQRHSKRIEGRRLRSIYDENDYVLSNGKLCPITPSSAQTQVSAFDPVRKYFLSRLAELVVEYGGEAGAIAGWTVDVNKRTGSILGGLLDITYVSPAPANRRHRSRVDALITLGLSPYAKAIKHMSREEIADMAVEIREKLLVAYQFDRLGNECLELVRNGDDIVVIPCPKADEIPLDGILASDVVLADNRDPVTAVKLPEKLYFGFGNITIVEWGRLVPDNAFHSLTELYPLGFKCVRQEHDIALDRVVDCCCEVLSQSQKTDSGQEEMVPLFRISVCWMLGRRGDERCVRVYEGRSPQLAWQAVLLEQIGLEQNANEPLALCTQNLASTDPCPRSNETPPSDGVVALCSGAAETTQEAVYSDCSPAPERVAIMEEADDEETRLRQELLSIRREHMKSLRSSQLNGNSNLAKPRLSLAAVDSLFGEGVLRLIEGMSGALNCKNYQFLEHRSQESGFRGLTQALSSTYTGCKTLQMTVEGMCERVDLLKRYPNLTDTEIENGAPITVKVSSKMPHPKSSKLDGDIKGKPNSSAIAAKLKARAAVSSSGPPFSFKKLKSVHDDANAKRMKNGAERQQEEALRQRRLAARNKLLNERKIRARDMEKMMRSVRENTLKNTVIKRSDARMLVESACDLEESDIRMKCSPFYTTKPMWNTAYAGCIDIAKGGDSNVANVHSTNKPSRPRVVKTALDVSDLGVFRELEGDAVGALLEVWALLHSYGGSMSVQKLPSPQVFLHSMLSCDHNYIQNAVGVNKAINILRDVISSASEPSLNGKKKPDLQLADPLELLHSLIPLDSPLLHQSEAEAMLTNIAIAMCKLLVPDFNFWMGVDEAAGILGELRPVVNAMTWKEIARGVLTSTLLQEIKGDAINTATVLRGKGHTTAPDSFDKRTLRLSRRRILAQGGGTDTLAHPKANPAVSIVIEDFDYSGYEQNGKDFISREKYRAICGKYSTFKNINSSGIASICRQTTGYNGVGGQSLGICVRLAAPGGCCTSARPYVNDNFGNKTPLIYSSLRGAACMEEPSWERVLLALRKSCNFDRTTVRRVLFLAIETAVSSAKHILHTKKGRESIAASRLLSELLKEETSSKDLRRRALLILDSFSVDKGSSPMEIMCPASVLDVWEYQQRMKWAPTATRIIPLDFDDAIALPLFIDAFEQSLSNVSVAAIISTAHLENHDTIVTAISHLSVETVILRLRYLLSLNLKATANLDDTEELDKVESKTDAPTSDGEKGRFVKAGISGHNDGEAVNHAYLTVDLAQNWERECIHMLPAVVQRCFNVIVELMVHASAVEFNYSVDFEKYPEFYACVRHPLCFADIRQCLVENRYPLQSILTSFYRDVMLVLENSLAFNPETDLISLSAIKIGYVFERLFFEGGLSVEHSWMPEACIACRQVNCPNPGVVDKTEAVLCDRCDGAYHLSCVNPVLEYLPRGDWYCPACTHGKQIRDVHPCVGMLVHRPVSKQCSSTGFSDIGRVVDFRHIGISNACVDDNEINKRFIMQYVVMFPKHSQKKEEICTGGVSDGAIYELWSGDDARKYSCRYGTGHVKQDSIDPVPILPAGYNYSDYDEACTLCRGYAGWSTLSPGIHPSLSGCCYLPAMSVLREDGDMAKYHRALVALSPLSCSSHMTNAAVFGLNEWCAVLQALSRRIINSQVGRDIATAFDDEATRSRIFSGSSISLVNLMCSLKGLFSGGPSVGDELQISGKDDDEEGLMDALDDTSTDSESDVEDVKKAAPNSQASLPHAAFAASATKTRPVARVEMCATDTDSEGDLERLKEKMRTDEPFDESMLPKSLLDPRRNWNSKRLSRRRGREDAFFTKQLLHELSSKVDVELAADVEAERALLLDLNGTDDKFTMEYYATRSAVFQTASRLFVNRPPDSVTHPEEWLRAWVMCHEDQADSQTLIKPQLPISSLYGTDPESKKVGIDCQNEIEDFDPRCKTCQFCGYDECTVGSTMVWGESREEFNVATYGSDAKAKDSFPQIDTELSIIAGCLADVFTNIEDLCNIWSDHVGAQKRRKLYAAFLSALNVAGRKCACSDLLNFDKKNDIVWAPVKSKICAIEESEIEELKDTLNFVGETDVADCETPLPSIRRGTMPVHECCAEFMNNLRKSSATRLLRRNIVLIGELVTSVRKGKTVPIGCDSNGNIYWILPGVRTSLYICVPHREGDPESHYKKMFSRENNGAGESFPINFPPDYCAVNRCARDSNAQWLHQLSESGAFGLHLSAGVESPVYRPSSEDVCSWRVLNGIFDIQRLLRWLRPAEHFCERQLHVVLQLLFPEVMVVSQNFFTLADVESSSSRKQASAIESIWAQLEIGAAAHSGAPSVLQSAVDEISDEILAEYANAFTYDSEQMDVDDEIQIEEDSAKEDDYDEDTVTEEESDTFTENLCKKKRKRTGSVKNLKVINNSEIDSYSDEAEANFSDDEVPAKRIKCTDKMSLNSSGDEGDNSYALSSVKRTSSIRRAISATSTTSISFVPPKILSKKNSLTSTKTRPPRGYIAPGTKVCVENSSNGLLWDAIVRKCCDFGAAGSVYSGLSGVYCYVHFVGWEFGFNSWVPVEEIQKHSLAKQLLAQKRFKESCDMGSNSARSSLPSIIGNLKSCQYLLGGGKARWCEVNTTPGSMEGLRVVLSSVIPDSCACGSSGDDAFNWGISTVMGSSSHKDIRLLKAAMLILEASLPDKCVDGSDERWGDADEGFTDYWRSAVVSATDAASLMECQILLEFSVRTAWLSASGAKLLTCMPSRTHATRFATYGLVALRVFALDEAIRYELARRTSHQTSSLSETEDDDDADEWTAPALQGNSSRLNTLVSRDRGASKPKPKKKAKKKR